VNRLALIGIMLALALGLSACGGNPTYSLPKTKACLSARGARISSNLNDDFVASTASGGAFLANLGDNSVKVVFGQNDSDAQQIQEAYEHFAFKNVKSGLPDVLRLYNNVVTLWHKHPQPTDLALVIGCLK
jgi:hypothetical protein